MLLRRDTSHGHSTFHSGASVLSLRNQIFNIGSLASQKKKKKKSFPIPARHKPKLVLGGCEVKK